MKPNAKSRDVLEELIAHNIALGWPAHARGVMAAATCLLPLRWWPRREVVESMAFAETVQASGGSPVTEKQEGQLDMWVGMVFTGSGSTRL